MSFALSEVVGGFVLLALTIYVLTGGADFGGGVWDLLARGPRQADIRRTIARSIGPIWEANHVWLIAVVVLMFVCFPRAFAAMSTALHVPLVVVLVGIVLRGSAFVFRTYDSRRDAVQRRWSLVFSVSSLVTPVFLGVVVGAVSSGTIRVDAATGQVTSGFFASWLAPFPFAVGLTTVALVAWLAAVYLTLETHDDALKDYFRARGLAAGSVTGALAYATVVAAGGGAPHIWLGLVEARWALPFQLVTSWVAIGAMAALYLRRYSVARVLTAATVVFVIWGWGWAQFPYVIPPDLAFAATAAPDNVLRTVLAVFAIGAVPLVVAYGWLLRVFKREPVPHGPSVPVNETPPSSSEP